MSQAKVDTAHDFALLVERLEGLLHLAVEQHPAVKLDALLGLQIFRIANRRRGRAQTSPEFVVNVSVLADLDRGEVGPLQPPIGDAVRILGDGVGTVSGAIGFSCVRVS